MDDNHFKVGEFASPKNKIFPSLVLFIIIEGNVNPFGEGVRISSSKFWDECHHYRKDDLHRVVCKWIRHPPAGFL